MIKYIPNLLSLSRIFAVFILLFYDPYSAVFFALYAFCGISDVLDGALARRLQAVSPLGTVLDSVSDTVFYAAWVYIFALTEKWEAWALVWVGVIVIIRLLSLLVGLHRFGKPAFLHTYANKATGLALFCFPVLRYFLGAGITVILLCSLATASACEEMFINLTATTLNRDIPSFLSVKQRKES